MKSKGRATSAERAGKRQVRNVHTEDSVVVVGRALTVEDVCAIVRACQQSNVASLSFHGLKLRFHVGPASSLGAEVLPGPLQVDAASVSPRRTAEELERQRRALRDLDEIKEAGGPDDNLQGIRAENYEVTQDELEMLKVTDPLAYEQLMNNDPEFENAKPG